MPPPYVPFVLILFSVQSYRPPTPPVQARCKSQRADDEDPSFPVSGLIPLHVVRNPIRLFPPVPLVSHDCQLYPHAPALHGSSLKSITIGPAASLTSLNAVHAEPAHSIHVSTEANVSTTLLGCHSTCDSTSGDDVKPKSSWPEMRVPPTYDAPVPSSGPRVQGVAGHSTGLLGRLRRGLSSSSLCTLCC